MTDDQKLQLEQEAGRIHEKSRERRLVHNRALTPVPGVEPSQEPIFIPEEKQRLAEITLLLAGGTDEEVQNLRKKWLEPVTVASIDQAELGGTPAPASPPAETTKED